MKNVMTTAKLYKFFANNDDLASVFTNTALWGGPKFVKMGKLPEDDLHPGRPLYIMANYTVSFKHEGFELLPEEERGKILDNAVIEKVLSLPSKWDAIWVYHHDTFECIYKEPQNILLREGMNKRADGEPAILRGGMLSVETLAYKFFDSEEEAKEWAWGGRANVRPNNTYEGVGTGWTAVRGYDWRVFVPEGWVTPGIVGDELHPTNVQLLCEEVRKGFSDAPEEALWDEVSVRSGVPSGNGKSWITVPMEPRNILLREGSFETDAVVEIREIEKEGARGISVEGEESNENGSYRLIKMIYPTSIQRYTKGQFRWCVCSPETAERMGISKEKPFYVIEKNGQPYVAWIDGDEYVFSGYSGRIPMTLRQYNELRELKTFTVPEIVFTEEEKARGAISCHDFTQKDYTWEEERDENNAKVDAKWDDADREFMTRQWNRYWERPKENYAQAQGIEKEALGGVEMHPYWISKNNELIDVKECGGHGFVWEVSEEAKETTREHVGPLGDGVDIDAIRDTLLMRGWVRMETVWKSLMLQAETVESLYDTYPVWREFIKGDTRFLIEINEPHKSYDPVNQYELEGHGMNIFDYIGNGGELVDNETKTASGGYSVKDIVKVMKARGENCRDQWEEWYGSRDGGSWIIAPNGDWFPVSQHQDFEDEMREEFGIKWTDEDEEWIRVAGGPKVIAFGVPFGPNNLERIERFISEVSLSGNTLVTDGKRETTIEDVIEDGLVSALMGRRSASIGKKARGEDEKLERYVEMLGKFLVEDLDIRRLEDWEDSVRSWCQGRYLQNADFDVEEYLPQEDLILWRIYYYLVNGDTVIADWHDVYTKRAITEALWPYLVPGVPDRKNIFFDSDGNLSTENIQMSKLEAYTDELQMDAEQSALDYGFNINDYLDQFFSVSEDEGALEKHEFARYLLGKDSYNPYEDLPEEKELTKKFFQEFSRGGMNILEREGRVKTAMKWNGEWEPVEWEPLDGMNEAVRFRIAESVRAGELAGHIKYYRDENTLEYVEWSLNRALNNRYQAFTEIRDGKNSGEGWELEWIASLGRRESTNILLREGSINKVAGMEQADALVKGVTRGGHRMLIRKDDDDDNIEIGISYDLWEEVKRDYLDDNINMTQMFNKWVPRLCGVGLTIPREDLYGVRIMTTYFVDFSNDHIMEINMSVDGANVPRACYDVPSFREGLDFTDILDATGSESIEAWLKGKVEPLNILLREGSFERDAIVEIREVSDESGTNGLAVVNQ